jgi:hypothetical protein
LDDLTKNQDLKYTMKKREMVFERKLKPPHSDEILTHGTRVEVDSWESVRDVFASKEKQIGFCATNFAVIDAAGPGRRVYQITSADDRSLDAKKTPYLLEAAGLLVRHGKNKAITWSASDNPQPLEFYWVVPHTKYEAWSKKQPKSPRNEIVRECLAAHVTQYVLEVPAIPPKTES